MGENALISQSKSIDLGGLSKAKVTCIKVSRAVDAAGQQHRAPCSGLQHHQPLPQQTVKAVDYLVIRRPRRPALVLPTACLLPNGCPPHDSGAHENPPR